MDDNLRNLILNYFNVTLKSSLGYRESYLPPTYDPYEGIIFFGKSHPDQPEDLKNILWSNRSIVPQLKSALINVLQSYFENFEDVKLILDPRGLGIEILRGKFTGLTLDPYVNIAINFETIEELDNFCRSTQEARNVCKRTEFWRSLVKGVYPQTYKGNYNYERVYKGYLLYKYYKRKPTGNYTEYDQLKDYINFMMDEGLPLNPADDDMLSIISIELGNQKLLDDIYNDFTQEKILDELKDTLRDGSLNALDNDNVKYVVNYMNMIALNDKYKDFINISDVLSDFRDADTISWDVNVWKAVYDVLSNYVKIHPVDARGQDNVIDKELNEDVISHALHDEDLKLFEEILKTGKFSDVSIRDNIWDYIEINRRLPPPEIFDILKEYLSKKDYDDIVSYSNNLYFGCVSCYSI